MENLNLDLIQITTVRRVTHLIFLIEYGLEKIEKFTAESRLDAPKSLGNIFTMERIKAMRFNTLMDTAKHFCAGSNIDFQKEIENIREYRDGKLKVKFTLYSRLKKNKIRKKNKLNFKFTPAQRRKQFPEINLKELNPAELLKKEQKIILYPGSYGNYRKKPKKNLLEIGKQLAEKKLNEVKQEKEARINSIWIDESIDPDSKIFTFSGRKNGQEVIKFKNGSEVHFSTLPDSDPYRSTDNNFLQT